MPKVSLDNTVAESGTLAEEKQACFAGGRLADEKSGPKVNNKCFTLIILHLNWDKRLYMLNYAYNTVCEKLNDFLFALHLG